MTDASPSPTAPDAPSPAAADGPAAPGDATPPLGHIALSLSGGGYRAAAFHLGVLCFLDRVRLLKDVVGLSTVSGGSIVGMAWVLSLVDKLSFAQFYDRFSGWLRRTNVIAQAADDLTSRRARAQHQWPSLIRSAATVYAGPDLFGDRRFGEVLDAEGIQLQEAIINATEFHTGVGFRFRRSTRDVYRIGNGNYPVPRDVARRIRVADIVGASSCFPGGFEPLVFPQHFNWPADMPLPAVQERLGESYAGGLPLMDGGIYDNQGVDALLLAFRRSTATTLLISDVAARNDNIYNIPPPALKRGWLTLGAVARLLVVLFVLTLLSALVLAWHGWRAARVGDWSTEDYLLYVLPGAMCAFVAVGLVWIWRSARAGNHLARQQMGTDIWGAFKRLTVPEFMSMAALRVGSLLALTGSIFMKHIRALIMGDVFRDEQYKAARMANLIYTLDLAQPKLYGEHPWLKPAPHLVKLALAAEAAPTTLWFDEHTVFGDLQRAGEATVCHVLLRFVVTDRKGQYEEPGKPLHDLYQRLRAEWEQFQAGTA